MTFNVSSELNQSRRAAKAALQDALAAHAGDPNHPTVAEAIATLATLNPTPDPTHNSALLEGDWLLISAPSFPDGECRADGTYSYTLGRLAFNMFQPKDLKVVIDRVSQPVFPVGDGSLRSHDIVVDFTTISSDLPSVSGIVRNLGVCEPSDATTLQVRFTGGALEPAEETNLQVWQEVFGNPSPPSRSSLKEWFQGQLLKLIFGLVPPTGMDRNTGRIEFQMRRSPKGSLTILYLDDELRITRGQKETILICERASKH